MCLYTLDQQGGHTESISSVLFHPELPLIITGSEDDMVNVWDSTTYKQITQL
jgi:coatomer subunit beta'